MKRVLTIQDISCVGKCSLTVALPIISACGIETSILPTAVLSTHTAFKGFTFRDLTGDLNGITKHWKNENIGFDSIYTGYLGSLEQIDIVSNIFDQFKTENNFIIVDPAMADNGKLYPGFDANFAKHMAKRCAKADYVIPNLTEASFILDIPYVESGYSEDYIKSVLKQLTNLGSKCSVLTGVNLNGKDIGAYCYDSVKDEYCYYTNPLLPVSFHGTGDIFASAFCGAITNGKTLQQAIKVAVDFTVESMKFTLANPNHNWYGVEFEKAIPKLIELLK